MKEKVICLSVVSEAWMLESWLEINKKGTSTLKLVFHRLPCHMEKVISNHLLSFSFPNIPDVKVLRTVSPSLTFLTTRGSRASCSEKSVPYLLQISCQSESLGWIISLFPDPCRRHEFEWRRNTRWGIFAPGGKKSMWRIMIKSLTHRALDLYNSKGWFQAFIRPWQEHALCHLGWPLLLPHSFSTAKMKA